MLSLSLRGRLGRQVPFAAPKLALGADLLLARFALEFRDSFLGDFARLPRLFLARLFFFHFNVRVVIVFSKKHIPYLRGLARKIAGKNAFGNRLAYRLVVASYQLVVGSTLVFLAARFGVLVLRFRRQFVEVLRLSRLVA